MGSCCSCGSNKPMVNMGNYMFILFLLFWSLMSLIDALIERENSAEAIVSIVLTAIATLVSLTGIVRYFMDMDLSDPFTMGSEENRFYQLEQPLVGSHLQTAAMVLGLLGTEETVRAFYDNWRALMGKGALGKWAAEMFATPSPVTPSPVAPAGGVATPTPAVTPSPLATPSPIAAVVTPAPVAALITPAPLAPGAGSGAAVAGRRLQSTLDQMAMGQGYQALAFIGFFFLVATLCYCYVASGKESKRSTKAVAQRWITRGTALFLNAVAIAGVYGVQETSLPASVSRAGKLGNGFRILGVLIALAGAFWDGLCDRDGCNGCCQRADRTSQMGLVALGFACAEIARNIDLFSLYSDTKDGGDLAIALCYLVVLLTVFTSAIGYLSSRCCGEFDDDDDDRFSQISDDGEPDGPPVTNMPVPNRPGAGDRVTFKTVQGDFNGDGHMDTMELSQRTGGRGSRRSQAYNSPQQGVELEAYNARTNSFTPMRPPNNAMGGRANGSERGSVMGGRGRGGPANRRAGMSSGGRQARSSSIVTEDWTGMAQANTYPITTEVVTNTYPGNQINYGNGGRVVSYGEPIVDYGNGSTTFYGGNVRNNMEPYPLLGGGGA